MEGKPNHTMPMRPKWRIPWLPFGCTVLLTVLVIVFHLTWDREITESPLNLPIRQFVFKEHLELLQFNEETQELWASLNLMDWWNTEWQDSANGATVHRGFHMFHMIHCLSAIRQEFTKLATDEERHLVYNARDPPSIIWRLHLAHCFDFVRQVSLRENSLVLFAVSNLF